LGGRGRLPAITDKNYYAGIDTEQSSYEAWREFKAENIFMVDLAEIAQGAKTFACTLYKNQPGALVPTPFSDALHFVWDSFCDFPGAPGLPPPPTKPFNGGQCRDFQYIVNYSINVNQGVVGQDVLVTDQKVLWGGFPGTFIDLSAFNANNNWLVQYFILSNSSAYNGSIASPVKLNLSGPQYYVTEPKLIINSVTRLDGRPDNCGELPKKFPDSPPPPPGGFTSPPAPFVLNDTTNYNFTFNFTPPTLPPPPALIDKLPPIVINFNKADINFKIPLTFNFDGTINFGSGGSGGSDFNQDDRDIINNIKNITNNTNNTSNNTNNNVDNFYGDYKKDRDRTINKEPLPDDFEPPKPPEPPGKNLVERLAYVNVDLSVIPSNAKSQSGKGAPNILYAGWFEFLRKDKSFPRNYIHFANNCFIAPVGADGYAFTLYNGYQGSAVAITFKE
jgi:hypothetical protein